MERGAVFTNVLQVCVVVRDLDKAVRRYADGYGIGPWKMYRFDESHKDMIVRDQPARFSLRIALCDIGGVNWELIQPLDDRTIYAEFLDRHGEGVQHVCFETADPEIAIEHAGRRSPTGTRVLQAGTVQRGAKEFRYTYLDTGADLGVVAEVWRVPPDWELPEPDEIYPTPTEGD